jgi:hypothetical protein
VTRIQIERNRLDDEIYADQLFSQALSEEEIVAISLHAISCQQHDVESSSIYASYLLDRFSYFTIV